MLSRPVPKIFTEFHLQRAPPNAFPTLWLYAVCDSNEGLKNNNIITPYYSNVVVKNTYIEFTLVNFESPLFPPLKQLRGDSAQGPPHRKPHMTSQIFAFFVSLLPWLWIITVPLDPNKRRHESLLEAAPDTHDANRSLKLTVLVCLFFFRIVSMLLQTLYKIHNNFPFRRKSVSNIDFDFDFERQKDLDGKSGRKNTRVPL